MDPEEGDFENLKESTARSNDESLETPSDLAHGKFKSWNKTDGKILKTTDVRVSRDQDPVGTSGLLPPEVHGPYNALDLETPKALHM